MKIYSKYFNAFTLAEMMVVLLIMSIVLACMAPVMTTKMKAEQNVQTSPWKWVQQGAGRDLDAYFGNGNLQMAHIGETERSEGDSAKLIINNSNLDDMILFKNGNNTLGSVRFQNDGLRIGSSNRDVGQGSVGIGTGIVATSNSVVFGNSSSGGNNSVVIGNNINENSGNAVVIGNGAIVSNARGIAVGEGAESGNAAVALGSQPSAHGSGSIAIGPQAMAMMESSIAIGPQALAGTADYSIAIGDNASATASYGIAIGKDTKAAQSDTIAIGNNAQALGEDNIAIGRNALFSTSTSSYTGAGNVAIGAEAMYYHNSINVGNTAVGYKAMKGSSKSSHYYNTAIGYEALTSAGTTSFSAGHDTAVGYQSLYSNTTGYGNTAVGVYALKNNVSGSYNTAIGEGACQYVTGSNKTCIGSGSGPTSGSLATNSDNIVFIGTKDSTVYIPGNLVVGKRAFIGANLGDSGVGKRNCLFYNSERGWHGVFGYKNDGDQDSWWVNMTELNKYHGIWHDKPSYGFDFADFGIISSDRRLKYVGKESTDGLEKIRQLKVFNYTFKKDEKKTPRVGVMAQDLQKIFPNAVKKGADGFLTIRMEDMFYAVINAIKELDARISALEKENKLLKEQNKALDARLKALEAKIK